MSSATTARQLLAPALSATRRSWGALVDVAIVATTLVGSVALLSRHGIGSWQPGPGQLDWIGGLLIAWSTMPLVAWRRAPRAIFLVTASASVLLGGLGYSIGLSLGPATGLYLLAASRDETDPWTRHDTATVIALLVVYLGASAFGDGGFPGSELLHTGLAWAVAWFAGERTRLRREQIAELKRRALDAERAAERERRLAIAEERARIARDLHDSAGHAINVIAVRAGAARIRHDQDPKRSRAALEAIEELARQTVGEIDQIVGTLRDRGSENGETSAPPGLASLRTLVAHHSAGGLHVTVATAGSARPLGAAVDLTAYRILQEALTNAARHGTGAAQVELAYGDEALQLTIINPAPDGVQGRTNHGHGLIGMRERASGLGGRLEADRGGGTFRLRAHLPYGGHLP
jgi:signal transduction histidine kinase